MNKRNTISETRPQNITCVVCGIRFHAPPSQIKDGRKYCSHKCRSTANPQRGKKRNKPSWNRLGETPLTEYQRVQRYIAKKRERAGSVLCACGCGESICALNAQGQPAKYKQGHQPGNLETAFKRGRETWNKGICGVESHSYVDGGSFVPYTPEFTKTLKERIRARDKHTCRLCGIVWSEGRNFTVHHINYIKSDCQESNLITLCNSCNLRVNNKREYWMAYFSA